MFLYRLFIHRWDARFLKASICRLLIGPQLSRMQDAGNPVTQGSGLKPAAIGQGRIIRCRRREMPLLVGGV